MTVGYRLSSHLIARLDTYLDESGTTRRDLADRALMKVATLDEWMNGERVPRGQAVRRLCRCVGVRLEHGLEPLSERKAA